MPKYALSILLETLRHRKSYNSFMVLLNAFSVLFTFSRPCTWCTWPHFPNHFILKIHQIGLSAPYHCALDLTACIYTRSPVVYGRPSSFAIQEGAMKGAPNRDIRGLPEPPTITITSHQSEATARTLQSAFAIHYIIIWRYVVTRSDNSLRSRDINTKHIAFPSILNRSPWTVQTPPRLVPRIGFNLQSS
jgi:hypothetical protein